MKTLKASILPVAVVLALAAGLAITPSCKNSGNTKSTTDTMAVDTMSTMKADTMSADTMNAATNNADTTVAHLPKKTHPVAVVQEPVAEPTEKIVEDKDHVYNHAEVAPVFHGGESALNDFVSENIRYPSKAIDNGAEGRVMVQFIVDEQGNVNHVTTLGEPIGFGLEEEAIRVISISPKWTPGKVGGKNVKAYVHLPIAFSLH